MASTETDRGQRVVAIAVVIALGMLLGMGMLKSKWLIDRLAASLTRAVGALVLPPAGQDVTATIERAHAQLEQVPEQAGAVRRPERSLEPTVPVVRYAAERVRDPLLSLLPREVSRAASGQPSRGTAAATPPPPAIVVEGVVWGTTRPQAIIEGELYNVGETVQGARIVAIDRGGITVEAQGRMFRFVPGARTQVASRRSRATSTPGRISVRRPSSEGGEHP